MLVEIDLPEMVVRKIRALNALEGGGNAASIQGKLGALIESALNQAIAAHLPTLAYEPDRSYAPVRSPTVLDRFVPPLEDGLGDLEETEILPEEDEEALVPRRGGLSERAIEHDMDVDDPEHEAKAEAPDDAELRYSKAEDAFAQIAGIPLPVETSGELDARIANRRKRLAPSLQRRVAPMVNEYEGDITSF